jgi:hypothetical protein
LGVYLCNYGPGLRKIQYTVWGIDGEYWAGNYGIQIANEQIIVDGLLNVTSDVTDLIPINTTNFNKTTNATTTNIITTTGIITSNPSSPDEVLPTSNSKTNVIPLVVGLIGGIGFLLVVLVIAIILLFIKRKSNQRSSPFINSTELENLANLPKDFKISNHITATYIIDYKKIIIKEQIGEGAFGKVYLGELNCTPVAIKLLHTQRIGTKELHEFQAEALTMKSIPPHPNLVLFRGICIAPLCLITDFCEGGSLYHLLKSNEEINTSSKLKWITEICQGMIHLHHGFEIQVIHRDLAARNILVPVKLIALMVLVVQWKSHDFRSWNGKIKTRR